MKFNTLMIVVIAVIIVIGTAFHYANNSTDMAPGDNLTSQENLIL